MSRVHVRLRVGRLRLDFQGEEAFFDHAIEPLLLQSARGGRPARVADPAAPAPQRSAPSTPPETRATRAAYAPPSDRFGLFQRQMVESGDGQASLIAAYAFFLWNYERKEVFREEEVRGCFEAGGEEPPQDASALYQELVAQRILVPGDEARTWRLTAKGKSHVRHHLLSA